MSFPFNHDTAFSSFCKMKYIHTEYLTLNFGLYTIKYISEWTRLRRENAGSGTRQGNDI